MKGAYSAPEEAGFPELDKALYKGTPYEYDSGGCPENIPDLTYEKFVLAHEKYYHPKNSVTVLDGKQDLEKSLALIDSHFSRFEDKNIEICKFEFTKEITPTETVYYDASDEEGEKSKIRLLRQTAFASFDDRCASLAGGIIADILAGTNDSPLKRELISRGLVEDVTLSVGSSALTAVTVEYRGIKAEDAEKIEKITGEVARKMHLSGVPREKISASLNRLEFRALEADYGARPRGVALALAAKNYRDGIWRVCFEGTPGAPVLFPKWTFAELSALPEGKGGGFLAKKYPERVGTVSARDRFELMDTDTPEDLEFLKDLYVK
jgi:Zn-dependent M16 (insulinase) family peptidase